jgi:hypothetical protein
MSTMQSVVISVIANTSTVRTTSSDRNLRFNRFWRRMSSPAVPLNRRALRSICAKPGATACTKTPCSKHSDLRKQMHPCSSEPDVGVTGSFFCLPRNGLANHVPPRKECRPRNPLTIYHAPRFLLYCICATSTRTSLPRRRDASRAAATGGRG